jgi:hypothetical protein
MGVKHVEVFGDFLLVVHQISKKYQCLDGSLNAYLDRCLDVIARLDEFSIHHIYRHENSKANDLAQQAFSYNVSSKNFSITKKLMCAYVQNLEFSYNVSSSVGLTGVPRAQTGLVDSPTSLTVPAIPDSSNLPPRVENPASDGLEHDKVDVIDWRRSIIDHYRKIQRFAFKFTLADGDLYR